MCSETNLNGEYLKKFGQIAEIQFDKEHLFFVVESCIKWDDDIEFSYHFLGTNTSSISTRIAFDVIFNKRLKLKMVHNWYESLEELEEIRPEIFI